LSGVVPIVTSLNGPGPIAAWPPSAKPGFGGVIIIRIDSPVDVLLTDASGKKLGIENGLPVNDFGSDGYDSGAGTHPRFYAIQNMAPGSYAVRSIGTADGPFAVHVYSADLDKPIGQHIVHTGAASPGNPGKHDFTLDAGKIAFANLPPIADAGADQTVKATSASGAAVTLNGSASSDPDGDALTFTWAGPFGLLTGAAITPTLPVGVHSITLTVNDGKGGTANATVTVTVNGTPKLAGKIIAKGKEPSGAYFVDLQLTNTGTGNASNIGINQLPLRTLSGSGTVSYNTTLSPTLPVAIANLDVGTSTTLRFYLNVPSTVMKFSVTENGTMQDVPGANYNFSIGQAVIP
jgi:hypothetical protein